MAGLFRPFKAYFHDSVSETYHHTFRFYGGQIVNNSDCIDFAYYFVPEDIEENCLKLVKSKRRNNVEKAFKIIDFNWITKCLQEKRLVDENIFMH